MSRGQGPQDGYEHILTFGVYTLAMPEVKKTDVCQTQKGSGCWVCACGCECAYVGCVCVCVCVLRGRDVNWLLVLSLFPRDKNDSCLVYTAN